MSRIYNQPKSTNNKMASSNGGAVLTRCTSVAMTTTASGGMRRQASASAATSTVGADPLRLVKIEASPLSAQAEQTLSLLEQQNEWKKEHLAAEQADNSNWETVS